MREEVTIVSLNEKERWESEHQRGGLPSQSWGYAWALSASGYEPVLAIVESQGSRMLLPFFKRQWKDTIDVATIPGLSGACIYPHSTAPLELWHEFATSQGWIAGYIQIAPWVEIEKIPMGAHLATHTSFMFLDLLAPELESSISRTVRRNLRKITLGGATLVENPSNLANSLRVLYPAAMRRFGAPVSFSSETIDRWARSPHCLLLGVSLEERVEAVHLGHVFGANAEWHIVGTSERGRSLSALIYWNAILRLREQGIRWLNMGGGARPGDGICAFKERFGAKPMAVQSLRQVYNHTMYERLCDEGGVIPKVGGWFPPYRYSRAEIFS